MRTGTNERQRRASDIVGEARAPRAALLLLTLSLGCAHGARVPSATLRSAAGASASSACLHGRAQAVRGPPEQTTLDAYRREGGVWLDTAPLLINEEFDMALAMSLEGGVGAGLAAAQRRANNLHKAAVLEGLALGADDEARLAQLHCCGLDVYFFLWGREQATLDMVIDDAGDVRASRIVAGHQVSLGTAAAATELSAAASELLGRLTCAEPG